MSQVLWNIAGRSKNVSGAFWSWSVCDAIDEQLKVKGQPLCRRGSSSFTIRLPALPALAAQKVPLFSHLCWETTRKLPRVADVPSAEVCSIP